jgi:diaminopimelate epimerase
MTLDFHKMHGAGNDFVVLDLRRQDFELDPARAARIADRRLGIGCDQILVIRRPADTMHAARYEIWNADGSPAGQCGNGARCIGLFLATSGEFEDESIALESPAVVITLRRCEDGEFEVGMGVPDFEPGHVPLTLEPRDTVYRLDSPWGELEMGAVSMGNPHALTLVSSIDDANIPAMGAFISTHEAFPEGCNAGFARLENRHEIRLRVVERGAGETLACGSGACAAVAILRQRGLLDDRVEVLLPGGRLVIKWPGTGRPIEMKGPAEHVFKGTLNG